jgi:hypothetical protein
MDLLLLLLLLPEEAVAVKIASQLLELQLVLV